MPRSMDNQLNASPTADASGAPFPAADASGGASPAAGVGAAVSGGGSAGRGGRVRRRVVVCGGVRGVFAADRSGVWRLANGGELAVLEGLGGSRDGVGRLRGLDAALAAGVAGPGDLADLARCLRSLSEAREPFAAYAPDELVPAVTVACSVWGSFEASQWLCWALASRLQGNLSDALWVGAGWQCWEARNAAYWEGDRWAPGSVDGLGGEFWERVRNRDNLMVREAAAASDPAAARRALRWMAAGSRPAEVLDIVASHPRASGLSLLRVCRAGRLQHGWRTAQNRAAAGWVLDLLARACGIRVPRGRGAAGRLLEGARHEVSWRARLLVFRSQAYSLSTQAMTFVCWLVAQNPSAPRRTIGRLARHSDEAVRSWAALHPRAGRRALLRLASDESLWVRRCVPLNDRAPRRAAARLASDRRREVRAAAAARPGLPGALVEQLAADRSLVVRAAVAARPGLSCALVEQLSEDPHWRVRGEIARRGGIASGLAARLAGDPDRRVRQAAANNPACPPDMLERLSADESRWVRMLAAENPACPPGAVARLAAETASMPRWYAAVNATCPPGVLDRLAEDRHAGVRQQAAWNPACPAVTLTRLASDRNRSVRAEVASNPSTPDRIVERLCGDDRVAVFSPAREALADRRQQDRGPVCARTLSGRQDPGPGGGNDHKTTAGGEG